MNEEKDLPDGMEREVPISDLTDAEVDEVFADLLEKAEVHLTEAGKVYSYLKEYGLEDPETARKGLEKLMDETEAFEEYVCELREYLASKHPVQDL